MVYSDNEKGAGEPGASCRHDPLPGASNRTADYEEVKTPEPTAGQRGSSKQPWTSGIRKPISFPQSTDKMNYGDS